MKRKISKMLAMVMVLSMVLGVGMVNDVYADEPVKIICRGFGYVDVDGKPVITEPCGEIIPGATLDEARANYYQHSAEAHPGRPVIGEEPIVGRLHPTDINLSNSTELVNYDTLDKTNGTDYFADETTNIWQGGTIVEETRVTVQRTSTFEITIPKEVVLDGNTGTADYKIKVKGDIAGDQIITVIPDANFILSEAGGKANVTATVTQPDTKYNYVKLQGEGTEYNGNISATLTAGEWSGKFNFNIKFI